MKPAVTSTTSELKGMTLPSNEVRGSETLHGIMEEACRRLKMPTARALEVLSRGWSWDPVTPRNASAIVSDFHRLQELLAEGQCVLVHRISRVEERSRLRACLMREEQELARDISAHLSMVEQPLEVLRALFEKGGCGLRPATVSAVLGIREETVGGDILRHPSEERGALFGRGGFMYQPSEPYELWQVFTLLNIKPGSLFCDVGSGYGHVLFYGALTRPDVSFKGIELMTARVVECEEARTRHKISNLSFVAGDVTQGGFSDADILFLFNPFPPDTMGAVVERIEQLARAKPLVVIDYGGIVTQRISSVVPMVLRDLEPYRIVCSRPHLRASCELIGREPPEVRARRGRK